MRLTPSQPPPHSQCRPTPSPAVRCHRYPEPAGATRWPQSELAHPLRRLEELPETLFGPQAPAIGA